MKFDPDKHHRHSIRLKGYDYTQSGAYFITICTQNRECLFGTIVDEQMMLNDYGRLVEKEWMITANIRSNVELDAFVVMPNHIHGILVITDNGRGDSAGMHDPSGRGDSASMHDPSGRGDSAGMHDPSGRGDSAGMHDPSGRGDSASMYDPSGRGDSASMYDPSGRGDSASRPYKACGPVSGSIGAIIGQFKSIVTKQINRLRDTSGAPVWQRNYYEHLVRDENDLVQIRRYIVYNPSKWRTDRDNPDNIP